MDEGGGQVEHSTKYWGENLPRKPISLFGNLERCYNLGRVPQGSHLPYHIKTDCLWHWRNGPHAKINTASKNIREKQRDGHRERIADIEWTSGSSLCMKLVMPLDSLVLELKKKFSFMLQKGKDEFLSLSVVRSLTSKYFQNDYLHLPKENYYLTIMKPSQRL